jgi:uracil-DNA glycosylase
VLELLESDAWRTIIERDVDATLINQLTEFMNAQLTSSSIVYPEPNQWFRALNTNEIDDVKVVILGQDPYHGPGQAQGLSFSVPEGFKIPPSLKNIFKEQATDLGLLNETGDLTKWSEQGVLLLNAVLTVEKSKAGSHAKKGWEEITDAIIHALSVQGQNIVFMLWGAYAEKKGRLIDSEKHLVLTAAHPSPLSAHRGWFGSQHFSKANKYLTKSGRNEINWVTSEHSQISLF